MELLKTFRLGAELAELNAAGDEIAALLEARGAETLPVYAARVALEELGTNVIKYSYPGEAPCWLEVRLSADDERFALEVEDGGAPFDPLQAAAPDLTLPLEEREIGGLGVHLVRQLMDRVEYRREDGKNRVRVERRLRE